MVTIQNMKTVFDELACKNGDNMIEWSQMDEALSRCGFKIKRHELEAFSLKTDRLSFTQFHSTIKTGVAKRKISQKLQKSRQDHAQDQDHSDAWGPLRKAVADYKKEGRVITKESYLKELQAFLNCPHCIEERQEGLRRKMEAGMKKRAAPVKLDEMMTILNDEIADKSELFTTEEQEMLEKMLERDLEKNFNAAVKSVQPRSTVEDLNTTTENK